MVNEQQPKAMRPADWLELHAIDGIERKAAAELRRLIEVEKQHNKLRDQRNELLEALRQTAMWLPILTEMAGLDAEKTQVELSDFQDDPSRPPETITIASSMTAARTAVAKADGEKQ